MKADIRYDDFVRHLQPYDGVKRLAHVVAVDTDKGRVTCYVTNDEGKVQLKDGMLATETIRIAGLKVYIDKDTPKETVDKLRERYGQDLEMDPHGN